jgi:anthranilate synthase component 1
MKMMMIKDKVRLKTVISRQLADFLTPVSLYLKVRDAFTDPVLLESNDFSSASDCFSYIGLQSIASISVSNGCITLQSPETGSKVLKIDNEYTVPSVLKAFISSFEVDDHAHLPVFNGFFGHVGFEGVRYFDTLTFDLEKKKQDIPDIRFSLYKYIIAINHYKNELFILENLLQGEQPSDHKLKALLSNQKIPEYPFYLDGNEKSNLTDEDFLALVQLGKHHCQIGDVFQIVFSRQFSQQFKGDEFNVYRVLRSINPSPYLFYFDYGSYKIFGSSPEAQIIVKENKAFINPIAGTYKRTGDLLEDAQRAKDLAGDPKENAEHIMLVDLARNDLGRHAMSVEVKKLKEIQYYSHVIHLVSTVEGKLSPDTNPYQIFADTFPAGTLSGAPKYKAIELISKYENQSRGFYGGSIGCLGFNGEINQAIVIRSFLSLNHTLFYQAGAGIVQVSDPESELQEVNNKLGALKKALVEAENIGKSAKLV